MIQSKSKKFSRKVAEVKRKEKKRKAVTQLLYRKKKGNNGINVSNHHHHHRWRDCFNFSATSYNQWFKKRARNLKPTKYFLEKMGKNPGN